MGVLGTKWYFDGVWTIGLSVNGGKVTIRYSSCEQNVITLKKKILKNRQLKKLNNISIL
jgi:hypothetical protein